MDLRRDDLKRTARAPAKLNLFLELLGRRDDGFHEVGNAYGADSARRLGKLSPCSVCRPRPARPDSARRSHLLADSIAFRECPDPAGPDNLVVRALNLLRQRSGCELGAQVELVKRIPAAAGLGGGSSDAAAALRLANRGWQIRWTNDRLAELAAEIGSDVPFFLSRGAAICRGRGERSERLPPIAPLHFVIVKPPVGLNTGDVYRAHDCIGGTFARDERWTRTLVRTSGQVGEWRGAISAAGCRIACRKPRVRCRRGSISYGWSSTNSISWDISFRAVDRHILAFVAMRSTHGGWQLFFGRGNWGLSTPRAVVRRSRVERKENDRGNHRGSHQAHGGAG